MHYGIVWGERQRVIPQDFPLILWEYSLSFSPYNTIMHCDNFSIDIVYYRLIFKHGIKKVQYKKLYKNPVKCVKEKSCNFEIKTKS